MGAPGLWSRAVGVVAVAGAATFGCEDAGTPPAEPNAAAAALPDPALPGLGAPDPSLVARLAQALRDKGPDYAPRTEHLTEAGAPKYVNRLILEDSPYLLQHAHNPVSWFAWGDEAFERAKALGKPVLLSVGYATCHWCHVMEKESFEDVEIATFLNEHFVCIKVDREERPDVDGVYMTAVQMMTGRGGWPMTVVLTPDRQPFFAGTYLPPRDGARGAAKGFLTVLRELSERYAEEPEQVVAKAKLVSEQIATATEAPLPSGVPGAEVLHRAARELGQMFDATWGGFGGAPKFPTPVRLEFLLRYARRTGDEKVQKQVLLTLDRMAEGGIYDHVGGGFHRYATDRRWLVPHFEKMLYDNAQLATLYLEAYQVGGSAAHRRVASEILAYLAKEMQHPEGGFYSATDADSRTAAGHLEEGAFFTWTPAELVKTLGDAKATRVGAFFGVTPAGNLDGRSVLRRPTATVDVASELGVSVDALEREVEDARPAMYATRDQRPRPLRDDKIIASYNGLAITAFARGALVLDRPEYGAVAARAATFVTTRLRRPDGRLLRSFVGKSARYDAYLDDYAFTIQGLLDLHEAAGDTRWLSQAIDLQAAVDAHYADGERGGYFITPDDGEKLLARDKPDYDGAEPSGNAVALSNLLRLAVLTGKPAYRDRASKLLAAFGRPLAQNPLGMTRMLGGLDFYLDRPREVVLVAPAGAEGGPDPALAAVVRRAYLPNRAILTVKEGGDLEALARIVPLVADKRALRDKTTAFVCTEGRCELPTSDPAVLAEQLAKTEPLPPQPAAPR